MTSMEYFRRKRIAVNPLHSLVLGVPSTKQLTVQNGPCVWPILAAPMSQGGHVPDKTCVIICIRRIMRIIVTGTKNILKYFEIEWLLPPSDLEQGQPTT